MKGGAAAAVATIWNPQGCKKNSQFTNISHHTWSGIKQEHEYILNRSILAVYSLTEV